MKIESLIRAITNAYRALGGEGMGNAVVIFVGDEGWRASLLDDDKDFDGDTIHDALIALARHVLAQSQDIADARSALDDLVAAGGAS